MTRQKEFIIKWKKSFRKFIGIRGMPEDSVELLLYDLFMKDSSDQVRRKIKIHNNNNIELIIKKK